MMRRRKTIHGEGIKIAPGCVYREMFGSPQENKNMDRVEKYSISDICFIFKFANFYNAL